MMHEVATLDSADRWWECPLPFPHEDNARSRGDLLGTASRLPFAAHLAEAGVHTRDHIFDVWHMHGTAVVVAELGGGFAQAVGIINPTTGEICPIVGMAGDDDDEGCMPWREAFPESNEPSVGCVQSV